MTTNVIEIIRVDGTREPIEREMTLEEMQKAVGGYIEHVPSNLPQRAMYANEDGIAQGLPVNHEATKLAHLGLMMIGGIRGNVLLVKA